MSDFSKIDIVTIAAIVAEHLQQHGIEVVLVGGLAVEIYTHNLYLTKDIDMVNTNYQPARKLTHAMAQLDFHKQGRVYVNASTDITVEFPSAPLSVGDEIIKQTTVAKVGGGRIPILKAEDVVKDRLAAFIHWQDRQSLIQATAILLQHNLKPMTFQAFCIKEGTDKDFQLLESLHTHAMEHQLNTMEELEAELTQLLLNQL
ncbi:MAG: hypothetical protein CMK89_07240 [Pseudomonadales bacterium]|nr:hypothetical protein [Pseudomonadales bacterium]